MPESAATATGEAAMNELIAISVADVGSQSIQTVNMRDLHEKLGVGRDFATWVKDRIAKYGFVEGQDYVTQPIDFVVPRNGGTRNPPVFDGAKTAIEYHASLDMAKELAMVENNDRGRAVRRYFIEVEKQFKSAALPDLSDPAVLVQLLTEHASKRIEAERRADAAERAVEAAKPKTDFYDKFADADGLYGLQNAARVLGQPPNKFIGHLKQGYLFYQGGALVPKVEFRERGIFEVKATDVDGKARYQTYVTPKGVQYFAKKLGVPAPTADMFGAPHGSEAAE